jgi:Family of unknown function (DUF6492)
MNKPSITPKSKGDLIWILLEKVIRKERYQQINGSPRIIWFPIVKIANLIFPDKNKYRNIVRYLSATRIENDPLEVETSLPPIEVLLMAKAADLELLELAIAGVWNQSANEVSRVNVVVPEKDFEQISLRCANFELPITVINENQLIDEKIRNLIIRNRPDRYGWILQQVIAAKWLLTTESKFILLLDVDTVLVRKKIWVNASGVQLLMPTFEYNPEYYKFFEYKSALYKQKKRSFVSHHLLVDTDIFREIFQRFWSERLDYALEDAFNFSSANEYSPFDLKFEIYSYYLFAKFPHRVALCKWANYAESRQVSRGMDYETLTKEFAQEYNSVSFHHYS